ncbi:hypothetical protein P170DRAFT_55757 [Aspergillus steynii IBT 23096]|uniref:Uncharacterized protein n=1 Tax=Aspergillus steynii IBT 23096 TaxID=1392250 RepID=A0A2I2FSE1_9EURO|nr:uncharacterized protein P170DRAFT_55757 [Aspergillus steynii IBT 23096]PLB43542.1 hypothetical protein P170DRAFT_55757 [Aspergillus steynii IBT 23096]
MDSLMNLNSAMDSLRFSDDQLRAFRLVLHFLSSAARLRESRWEVGTCIPEALFNSVLSNQKRIQRIALITDGECGATNSSQNYVDLVQVRELRSLDWRGLCRYTDFESVRQCVRAHGHQIQSLTLDLLTWDRAEDIWAYGYRQQSPQRTPIPDNFFSQRVLNIQLRDKTVIFSSLESLHLSGVSFYHTGMEMAYAFNVGQLKSLKLRNCPGSFEWVGMILEKPMKLKSFELALDLDSIRRAAYLHITETICNFLQYVSDLESLYLALPVPIDWTTLTDRLSSHCHLRRFVIHNLMDRGGQNLIDGDIPWSLPLKHMLQKKQLTCFGSSMAPRKLTRYLQMMQPKPSCKMIHIRTSGVVLDRLFGSRQPNWFSQSFYAYKYGEDFPYKTEDIYNFAQWAFGADGLSNLQVLAWGDFSYRGRYSKFNLLLCRSDGGYRTLTPSDTIPWSLVQDNLDMLAACAFEDILE